MRLSLGKYTTEEDVDKVLGVLPPIVEKLRRILNEDIPCAISVVPETLRENGRYSSQDFSLSKYIDLVAEVVNKPGNILGQQGNMQRCKYSYRFTDPLQENFCLWEDKWKNFSEQKLRLF